MSTPASVAVIGAGPAGLMAAEVLAVAGLSVQVFDAMPSAGRKLLLAGIGGLNITHAEPFERFVTRYGTAQAHLQPCLTAFGPDALRAWVQALGIDIFVGSSQRVFPVGMKAAPLLRAWLRRLRAGGVRLYPRHRWLGWDAHGALRFAAPQGECTVAARACVLALGGASWPQLGSDAAWVPWLQQQGVKLAPLQAANCGWEVPWSAYLADRFAGAALKPVVLRFADSSGQIHRQRGECIVTAHGLEGSLVYALSAVLRDTLAAQGRVTIHLDLAPDRGEADLATALAASCGKASAASRLRKCAGIEGVKLALLHECAPQAFGDPQALAHAIKALPVILQGPRPLAEAISTAGGVAWDALDARFMLKAVPGVFCAGEMLDWEAPTGGYLLTACMATGRAAGAGALAWLAGQMPVTSVQARSGS